jgi:hypothetical protein
MLFFQPRPCSAMSAASGSGTHVFARIARAVGLAEGVAARDQGHGFFVVHGHAGECVADVAG